MGVLLAFVWTGLVACDGRSGSMMIADAARGDSGRRDDAGGGLPDTGPDTGPDVGPPIPDSGPTCMYPEGAVEPMALGEVLWPYHWPEAIDGMGLNFPIDLSEVQCTADENIDWSPFDVLVFIAIPAW